MARFKTIHQLRKEVTARHKALLRERPDNEGVDLLVETYQTTSNAAQDYVDFLKGKISEEAEERQQEATRGSIQERLHWKFNEETFEWEDARDEEAATE